MTDEANRELTALTRRLERPVLSLSALEQLPPEQLRTLREQIEQAQERHQKLLDQALERAIPWLLRAPVLRWLRR